MRLDFLAHDERRYRAISGTAQRGHGGADGIRTEGQTADGIDVHLAAVFERELRDEVQATPVQRHLLAVDVVGTLATAREREIPIRERTSRDQPAELVAESPVGVRGGRHAVHRSTGWRAASTSSTRLT